MTADEYRQGALAAGLAPEEVEPLVELFTTVLDGRNASVAHGVRRALGRPPRDFDTYAHDAASSGVWSPAATPLAS